MRHCWLCGYLTECWNPRDGPAPDPAPAVTIAHYITVARYVPLCARHLAWAQLEWGDEPVPQQPLTDERTPPCTAISCSP
jgi:hypothetical protein